uniref:Aspartate aminotransferase n=1 Tax=Strigomonas oncopelti TaxID=5657 RepID=U5KM70_STROO|nr:mitochondrial aspartate transaminase [Strigomonas oncopelti]
MLRKQLRPVPAHPFSGGSVLTRRHQCTGSSFFNMVKPAPADAIFGLMKPYNADKFPQKVNLSVGVYRDEQGQPFVLESVRKAAAIALDHLEMEYAPITGFPAYVSKATRLCFGDDAAEEVLERVASVQTLSGTGALRLGGEIIRRVVNSSQVNMNVSSPTYPNHINIYKEANFNLLYYPYYDEEKHTVNVPALLTYIKKLPEHSFVLLHACCHNPTGCDPTQEEWREVVAALEERQVIPFVDMAYQGFATGDLDRDAFLARAISRSKVPAFFIAQSFAKNFGLYGHRAGCLHVGCDNPREKEVVLSQASQIARSLYSNPPIYGATIVNTILGDEALTQLWKSEVALMAKRLSHIRQRLVEELAACGCQRDFSHLATGAGMVSLTGLKTNELSMLRDKHHIYMTQDGRIAFPGLNETNVKYVAEKIKEVVSQ